MKKKTRTKTRKQPIRSVAWLRKWHQMVIAECGTDDIAVLLAHKNAYDARQPLIDTLRQTLRWYLERYPRLADELESAVIYAASKRG